MLHMCCSRNDTAQHHPSLSLCAQELAADARALVDWTRSGLSLGASATGKVHDQLHATSWSSLQCWQHP